MRNAVCVGLVAMVLGCGSDGAITEAPDPVAPVVPTSAPEGPAPDPLDVRVGPYGPVYRGCDFVRTACVTAQFERQAEPYVPAWRAVVVCTPGEGQPPQACAFSASDGMDIVYRDGRREMIGGAGVWDVKARINTRDVVAIVFVFNREAATFPGSPGDSYMPLIVAP